MANTHSTDLELDSSQYWSITDANQTGLDITGDITIEAWVKIETAPSEQQMVVVSKWVGGGLSYLFGIREFSGSAETRFWFRDSSGNQSYFYVSKTFNTGQWYHLAWVIDVSVPSATMYIDTVSQTVVTSQSNATSIINGSAEFQIGNKDGGTSYFDGLIDDVRVWSDKRTSAEISNNWKTELAGTEANLMGYWKFNNDGTDETSNGNDLTNNNTATFVTDVPFTTTATFIPKIIMS